MQGHHPRKLIRLIYLYSASLTIQLIFDWYEMSPCYKMCGTGAAT
jgi:hypothetical protein